MTAVPKIAGAAMRLARRPDQDPDRDAILHARTRICLQIVLGLSIAVAAHHVLAFDAAASRLLVLDMLAPMVFATFLGILRRHPAPRTTRAVSVLATTVAVLVATAGAALRGEFESAAMILTLVPISTGGFFPWGWASQVFLCTVAEVALEGFRLSGAAGELPWTLRILVPSSHLISLGFLAHARNERSKLVAHLRGVESARQEIRRLDSELEKRVAEREVALDGASRNLQRYCRTLGSDLRLMAQSLEASLRSAESASSSYPEAGPLYSRANMALQRLERVLEAMLDYGDLFRRPLQPSDIDLAEYAREHLALLREAHPSREVNLCIDSSIRVTGDAGMLSEVIAQLVDNAWRFTAGKRPACIEVGVRRGNDGEREYFVRDNGSGLDLEHSTKLFRPFTRLESLDDDSRTGMGLARVARIVERHGGLVRATARPGEGVEVAFTIGRPATAYVAATRSRAAVRSSKPATVEAAAPHDPSRRNPVGSSWTATLLEEAPSPIEAPDPEDEEAQDSSSPSQGDEAVGARRV